ncbi:MAG: protein-export membrane protein SecF [Candidatus Niyogibacteria bacterium RIFCSPLOWO2_12_FULL_41_13]|uniref:Protein-export membrane protein SecF n=1 Tax=Candidatus Niyogibacteria bacterium RIFCSPLOWO2_12_FULL_41_13 TaxID=1801726 RepID=A0A1G2F0V7_9BACT|nr:MAG: protein-export membrane protein SecF [Candidatus Niyogibacteria bacterium RIFCSPLOWO2_12_FULL_41_13]
MFVVNYRKIFYIFSGLTFIAALFFFINYGVRPAIDFTGGSLMEIKFDSEIQENEIREKLKNFNLGEVEIKKSENATYILRFKDIDQNAHEEIVKNLNPKEELRFDSIGPVIGKELKNKAALAIIISLVLMIIYMAIAFRQISYIFTSWSYGFITIITLIFDIIVVLGVFAYLGRYHQVEVGLPFIAAILAVIGYSINDRIIIFDRIRENLMKSSREEFSNIIGESLRQTYIRSLNTGMGTLLVITPIIILGGETIKFFVLTLVLGIVLGTYSSIFLAAPLLLELKKLFR